MRPLLCGRRKFVARARSPHMRQAVELSIQLSPRVLTPVAWLGGVRRIRANRGVRRGRIAQGSNGFSAIGGVAQRSAIPSAFAR